MSISEIASRIHDCTACPLAENRTGTVPGVGPEDAEIMFIGEAPGANEDKTGRPFSGKSGEYLDRILHQNGIDRSKIFITNIVKCRPPNNRDPEAAEIAQCRDFLQQQIDAIDPKLIVSIGAPATRWFRPKTKAITEIAGMAFRHEHRILVPVMHPAAGLRRPSSKPFIEENFRRIASFLNVARLEPEEMPQPKAAPASESPDQPEELPQHTLF